jgi:phosphomevalonate kinase
VLAGGGFDLQEGQFSCVIANYFTPKVAQNCAKKIAALQLSALHVVEDEPDSYDLATVNKKWLDNST